MNVVTRTVMLGAKSPAFLQSSAALLEPDKGGVAGYLYKVVFATSSSTAVSTTTTSTRVSSGSTTITTTSDVLATTSKITTSTTTVAPATATAANDLEWGDGNTTITVDGEETYWEGDTAAVVEASVSAAEAEAAVNLRASLVYSAIFILAIAFGMFAMWDAVMHHNIVQVLAATAHALGLTVFTVIQFNLSNTIASGWKSRTNSALILSSTGIVRGIEIALVAIACAWFAAACFMVWQLRKEFAWKIYRSIGGDIRLET
ncbi:hypothetical protein HDU96_001799, partial [Phlyctochytrium bullatum]